MDIYIDYNKSVEVCEKSDIFPKYFCYFNLKLFIKFHVTHIKLSL